MRFIHRCLENSWKKSTSTFFSSSFLNLNDFLNMIGFWFRVSTPTPDSGVEDRADHVNTLKIKVNVGGEVAARQPPHRPRSINLFTRHLVYPCSPACAAIQHIRIFWSSRLSLLFHHTSAVGGVHRDEVSSQFSKPFVHQKSHNLSTPPGSKDGPPYESFPPTG
jgi:hypothetical protein